MARQAHEDPLSLTIDEGMAIYNDAEANALARLDRLNLPEYTAPPRQKDGSFYTGRIPPNISSLSPGEIGTQYALHVAYTDYLTGQNILAQTEYTAASEKLELVRAAVRRSKVGTAQEKADQCAMDTRYVHANAAALEAKTYRDLVGAHLESATRDLRFISRLIETKKMEQESFTREGNLDNARRPTVRGRSFRS